MNTHLEIAYKELERVSAWIENADTKSNIILALNGGLFAVFVGNLNDGSIFLHDCLPFTLAIIFLGALGYSVYSAMRVLLPDVVVKSKYKLFFFGSIKTLSSEDYKTQFVALTDDQALHGVLDQVHVNSVIASNKFSRLKQSIVALGVAAISIFIFVLLEVLT